MGQRTGSPILVCLATVILSLVCSTPLQAAELKLALADGLGPPFSSGETVTVVLSVRDLGQSEAAGYQAFLSFDSSKLLFLAGTYLPEAFAVVTLLFVVTDDICLPPVSFRDSIPPNQVTDLLGIPIPALELVGLLPSVDCNDNEVDDACDIADGTSPDDNGNGIPDECECEGDLNGNGAVEVLDFLALLAVWGPCVGCPADLDGSGAVDVLDFLILLANWGPCP
jgi:hypothetical protein